MYIVAGSMRRWAIWGTSLKMQSICIIFFAVWQNRMEQECIFITKGNGTMLVQ